MTPSFPECVQLARRKKAEFAKIAHADLIAGARAYVNEQRAAIRDLHASGASGADVVAKLTELADEVVRGALDFALHDLANRRLVLQNISLCAQGGYGRAQLNPFSDLDISILYEGTVNKHLRAIATFLSPFLFDIGYANSVVVRSIKEATELAKADTKVYTSYLECRLLAGNSGPYARLRLSIRGLRPGETSESFAEVKLRERSDSLPEQHRDLYAAEPHVKEGAGGLRDYHAALWLLTARYDISNLDQAVGQSILSAEERLEVAEAVDFLWRVRNELHFRANKADDKLSFANQRAIAKAFGYPQDAHGGATRLMEDYYGAARRVRRCLRKVARTCDYEDAGNLLATPRPGVAELAVEEGELYAGHGDAQWFEENPARLMSVFWECARRDVTLSHPTERLVEKNLHLVNDAFRSNALVKRFFVGIGNRPLEAGRALRQAAHTGLLSRYLPEFGDIRDVVRYEDFHSYPVDEHTLRAIEALAFIPEMEGPVGRCLNMALENLPDPYILVFALLFHDLGKATGETHVAEGVRLTRIICERIGLLEDDQDRIAFLVAHHMLMSEIGLYRDTDEESVVLEFAQTMKSEDRVRALFLLTYADMSAVGPNVWNDWKGALLLKLYLRTEKVLLGRAQRSGRKFLDSPKYAEICEAVPQDRHKALKAHLKDLGERYFVAFAPQEIATHLDCVMRAAEDGVAVSFVNNDETQMTHVVVCTRDRSGLFAEIAGCFASQLIDVNDAALYTRADGTTVDCFTVVNAVRSRPLTKTQIQAVEKVLRAVLQQQEDVQTYLEQAQRRLFGLLQSPLPVPTELRFDNEASASHTVIDVRSGDRTGILYSISKAIADCGLDIANARIVTDAHRVRDSFYVTLQGAKIEDQETQAHIADAIRDAIHPRPVAEKGGIQ